MGGRCSTRASRACSSMLHSCAQDSQVRSTRKMPLRPSTVDTRWARPWAFPHAGHCCSSAMTDPRRGSIRGPEKSISANPYEPHGSGAEHGSGSTMKLLGLTRCHGVRGVLARVEHRAIITADRAIVARSQSCAARCRSVVPRRRCRSTVGSARRHKGSPPRSLRRVRGSERSTLFTGFPHKSAPAQTRVSRYGEHEFCPRQRAFVAL